MCVCVCVCPTWDIRNGSLYHHTAYTILKSFLLQVLHSAFQTYTMHGLREKPLKVLPQLCNESCAVTVTLPITLGWMNLAYYKKSFGILMKGMRWRTFPPHHWYRSYHSFLREWPGQVGSCPLLERCWNLLKDLACRDTPSIFNQWAILSSQKVNYAIKDHSFLEWVTCILQSMHTCQKLGEVNYTIKDQPVRERVMTSLV